MRKYLRLTALIVALAALYSACGGGGGGRESPTGPTATPAPPTPAPGPAPGPGSGGGDPGGGSGGGGGGTGTSLSTAHFRELEIAVTPPGAGVVSDDLAAGGSVVQQCTACRERYRVGALVTLTASASPGWVFERWQGGGCDGATGSTCRLRITEDARITAVFRSEDRG